MSDMDYNQRRVRLTLPNSSVIASVMLIALSPLELLVSAEQYLYIICIIPLLIGVVHYGCKLRSGRGMLILLFMVYMMITCIWTPAAGIPRKTLVQLVTLLFLFLQLQFSYTKEEIIFIKRSLYFQFFLLVIIIFLYGQTAWDGRLWIIFGGSKTDSNSICTWIIPVFCLSISDLFDKKQRKKYIYIIAIFFSVYVFLWAGSRSGILVMALCAGLSILHSAREIMKQYPTRSFIILIFGIIAFVFVYRLLPDSIISRFEYSNTSSLGGRSNIWTNMLHMLINSPLNLLFGFGENATITLTGVAAHNMYIEILFNNGLFGLSIILSYIISAVKQSWKEDKTVAIIMIGIAVMSATLSEFSSRPVMISLFLSGMTRVCIVYREEDGEYKIEEM